MMLAIYYNQQSFHDPQNSGLIECTSKKRETIFTIDLPVKGDINE